MSLGLSGSQLRRVQPHRTDETRCDAEPSDKVQSPAQLATRELLNRAWDLIHTPRAPHPIESSEEEFFTEDEGNIVRPCKRQRISHTPSAATYVFVIPSGQKPLSSDERITAISRYQLGSTTGEEEHLLEFLKREVGTIHLTNDNE